MDADEEYIRMSRLMICVYVYGTERYTHTQTDTRTYCTNTSLMMKIMRS
jgi:hypothetical protein